MSSLSLYEGIAMEFVMEFQRATADLKKNSLGQSVTGSYFNSSGEKKGFLQSLNECLEQQGFNIFSKRILPKLEDGNHLPIKKYSECMALLPKEDLEKLSKFYDKMEMGRGKGEGYFPAEYKELSSYFATSDVSTNDSAEAGRLVMMISTLSQQILELKELLNKYTGLTLLEYEKILKKASTTILSEKAMNVVDAVRRRAIDHLIEKISFPGFPLVELQRFLTVLGKQKNRFLQVVIVQAQKIKNSASNKLKVAKRNIGVFTEWELYMKEQEKLQGKKPQMDRAFSQCYDQFKSGLEDNVRSYESLSDRIDTCLSKKEVINPYFSELLDQMSETIKQIFRSEIQLPGDLKRSLQSTLYHIQNTLKVLERHLAVANKEFENFPEILKERLNYLSKEITEVLSRGNPMEIKYMSVAFDASLKHADKNIRKLVLFHKVKLDPDRCCELYRKRFAEIIKTAAKVIKSV